MDCTEFLSLFSEYYDGSADPGLRSRMDDHREACPSCRRYLEVVDRGVDLLRSLPSVPVPSDFRERLRHRIYHVADEEALGRPSASSGVRGAATLAMAALLALAAWTPALQVAEPEVTLPPIVVSEAPTRRPALRVSPASFFGPSLLTPRSGYVDGWGVPEVFLHPYPGLTLPDARRPLLRAGLD